MTISSRTPEGDPNTCPVCGNRLKLEPSLDTRDAPCPHCGHLLWFGLDSAGGPSRHGFVEGMANVILRLWSMRFGPPLPSIRERVLEIRDGDALKKLAKRLLEVQNWQELLEK